VGLVDVDVVDVVTELVEVLLVETLVDVTLTVPDWVDEGTALNNATIDVDVVGVVTELVEVLLVETLVDVDVVGVVTELVEVLLVETLVEVTLTVPDWVDEGTALNNATIVPGELIIALVVADEELVKVMLEFVSHPTNS